MHRHGYTVFTVLFLLLSTAALGRVWQQTRPDWDWVALLLCVEQGAPDDGPDNKAQSAADTSETEGEPAIPPQEPEPQVLRYDFSQPAPQGEGVDNSYFQDAAFVGDSRTDGLLIYSGIGCGKNLTSNGLTIFQLAEKKALKIDGQMYTLLEALALEQYAKVYFSLGINELGYYDDEGFYRAYCRAIDEIRALQPDAVIYIQGLIPLNEPAIAQSGGKDYLTNEHLRVFDGLMRKVAQEKQVAFLDLYTEFADETGALPDGVSRDGVHLRSEGCRQWLAYLQAHTVEFEALYPDGVPQEEVVLPDGQQTGEIEQ